MTKKLYNFQFPIEGSCSVDIIASSEEEAARLILGPDIVCTLSEWNANWPCRFENYTQEEILSYATVGKYYEENTQDESL